MTLKGGIRSAWHGQTETGSLLIPLDSSLRRAATGILGGLFQTPLYHLHPCRRVHK